LFLLTAIYGFTWFLIPFFIYGKAHIGIFEYSQENYSNISIKSQLRLIQHQSISDLKFWFYTSMVLFVLLEIGLITESGIYYFGNDQIKTALTSAFGSIFLKLPGSQTIYAENLRISIIIWIILIFYPLMFFIGIIFLYYRMRHLDKGKKERLQYYLMNLPEEQRLLLNKSLEYIGLIAKIEK
jgi:hypothetical protein